jgi:hypothetical protein
MNPDFEDASMSLRVQRASSPSPNSDDSQENELRRESRLQRWKEHMSMGTLSECCIEIKNQWAKLTAILAFTNRGASRKSVMNEPTKNPIQYAITAEDQHSSCPSNQRYLTVNDINSSLLRLPHYVSGNKTQGQRISGHECTCHGESDNWLRTLCGGRVNMSMKEMAGIMRAEIA